MRPRPNAELHKIDYYETKKWSGARWSRDINIAASELKGRFLTKRNESIRIRLNESENRFDHKSECCSSNTKTRELTQYCSVLFCLQARGLYAVVVSGCLQHDNKKPSCR